MSSKQVRLSSCFPNSIAAVQTACIANYDSLEEKQRNSLCSDLFDMQSSRLGSKTRRGTDCRDLTDSLHWPTWNPSVTMFPTQGAQTVQPAWSLWLKSMETNAWKVYKKSWIFTHSDNSSETVLFVASIYEYKASNKKHWKATFKKCFKKVAM